MRASSFTLLVVISILFSGSLGSSDSALHNFLQCLPKYSETSKPISEAIYTPNNASFQSIFDLRTNNLRVLTPEAPKPLAIITALHESHVQATVICGKQHGLQVRIRSGGHDYEGLSFISYVPFVILDMFNLHSIKIDMATETAWVQAGATTGELYYRIAEKSKVHAFPSGVCTTLGIGGHLTGGGYGPMLRKFGLSVDNVVDAQLVDVKGRILDRKSMGEDVFWAIRGGGGTSFGIILSWKIKLVRVPPKVTVFRVGKTLEEGVRDVAYKWQHVAPKLPEDLFIRLEPVAQNINGSMTVRINFVGHFLGQSNRLLRIMNSALPELGLKHEDCFQMSWVESTLFWAGFPNGTSIDVLLNRTVQPQNKVFSKTKSDYYKNIIPKSGLEILYKKMMNIERIWVQLNPYGGRMAQIGDSDTAFAHRAGNLFKVQYSVFWTEAEGGNSASEKYVNLIRDLYEAMAPYASHDPREAFLNYRDIDIGSNGSNETNFEIAKVYGAKYFRDNFQRLARVKAMIDPDNFFRNEQSIPPYSAKS